jgi:hypothetical protein
MWFCIKTFQVKFILGLFLTAKSNCFLPRHPILLHLLFRIKDTAIVGMDRPLLTSSYTSRSAVQTNDLFSFHTTVNSIFECKEIKPV